MRRPPAGLQRALAACILGVLVIGSVLAGSGALLPGAESSGGSESWQYTRVAESARLRAGLSAVRPGEVAVIQFSLGAYRGADVFMPGAPTSVEIGCASRTAFRTGPEFDPTAHGTLDYDAERDVYTYRWVTSATWAGTCRRLTLEFADGSAHPVFLWFGDPFGVVPNAPLPT